MTVAILSFSYTWLVAFVSVTPEVLVLLGWMFDVDAMGPNVPTNHTYLYQWVQ